MRVLKFNDRTTRIVLLIIFGAWGCAVGCSGGSQSAMLRVVNGIWGSPLNVTIGGASAGSVPYSSCVNGVCTALSGYVTVKSGGVNLVVEQEGSSTNIVPSQFQNLNLQPNTRNTIVFCPVGGTAIGAFLLQDDDTPAANSVKLRVANVSINVPNMPAWIVVSGTQPSGNPTIANVPFGSASTYMTFSPNTYDIWLVGFNCGLDSNCGDVTATLKGNQNVTVYLLYEGLASRPTILADN